MRRSLPVLCCLTLFLTACVPPTTTPRSSAPSAAEQAARTERFQQQLAALPGAVLERQGELLTIRYPDQALFADGAALPFPGGREMLDPLSDLLLLLPSAAWQGTVRVAAGSAGGEEQPLAAKRLELLGRYFERRGLPAGTPALRGDVAAGAPLELRLQPAPPVAAPATSAAEKR